MLHEQCAAKALFNGLDVPRHGGMGSVQAARGSEQTPATLELEKEAQVIPVEHHPSLGQRCLKTHSSWVKTNIL
jgi:hypothetical protein